MIHSKVIDILKTFSKEELKQFSEFLHSPFHNKNKNLLILFETLLKYHPDYNADNEIIFQTIYPAKEYSHDSIKKLMSELIKAVESFLSHSGLIKEKFLLNKILLKELSDRKIDNLWKLKIKKLESDFPEEYPDYYNNKSALEGFKVEFNVTRNTAVDFEKIHNDKFSYDTCYYLFQALIYIHCTTSLKNSYSHISTNKNLNDLFLNFDFDSFIKKSVTNTHEDKTIYLLCNLIKMFIPPDDESFFYNSKKVLLELFDHETFEIRDDYTLYISVLTSYCTRKMRERKLNFCNEQLKLHKHRFKVLENTNKKFSKFTRFDFSNIINLATFLGEIDWAEEFVSKVNKYFFKEDYEFNFNYGNALIELRKSNFEKALEYSSKTITKDHVFKVALINLKLMCYYDLDFTEEAFSAIDAFNHQVLNSDKFNDRYKTLQKSFIDIYKKMLNFKVNPQKISDWNLKELEKMIDSKEFSLSDHWFLEKLKELSKIHTKSEKDNRKLQA
ncbi:MAG: hypothetical protein WAT71_10185 [Ignavibacteria bacterium]